MSEERRPAAPGCSASPPERGPQPTAWPALFAFGVTLFAWGLVSSFVLVVIGGALLFYSLLHWIGEIVHDAK